MKFAYSNNPVHRIGATDSFLSKITENGPAYLIDPRCSFLKRGMAGGYHYPISRKGEVADGPKKNIFSHICESGQYGDMYFERLESSPDDEKDRRARINDSHERARQQVYGRRS